MTQTDNAGEILAHRGGCTEQTTSMIGILGTGSQVPNDVVANTVVGALAQVDDEWIRRKTGIVERRWVAPEQATSDLAVAAGRNALDAAGIEPADLTLIIVATSTPDSSLPPTACRVQHALSAYHAAAFDLNAVCSGFVYSLAVAQAQLASLGGYALVIGADTYSRILNPTDRRTVILFGDGAGAVVLGISDRSIATPYSSALFSFGDLADLIQVPAGGSRIPYSPAVHEQGLHYFTMDGQAVRRFVIDRLPQLVEKFLAESSILPSEVRHCVPHQANKVMLDELFPKLGLPNATLHRTVELYGNTGAASIPITLDQLARSGEIAGDDVVLLVGFGGGMSVGLSLIRWSRMREDDRCAQR